MRTLSMIGAAVLMSLGVPAGPGIAQDQPSMVGPAQWVPPPARDGYSYPDCFCTNTEGQRVEKGQTACLRIGGDEFLARCGMSLNNPAWRRIQDDCGPIS